MYDKTLRDYLITACLHKLIRPISLTLASRATNINVINGDAVTPL